jgi:hypothetical protein
MVLPLFPTDIEFKATFPVYVCKTVVGPFRNLPYIVTIKTVLLDGKKSSSNPSPVVEGVKKYVVVFVPPTVQTLNSFLLFVIAISSFGPHLQEVVK